MKKLLYFSTVATLGTFSALSGIEAGAQENLEETDINHVLMSRDYPIDVLEGMPFELKQQIASKTDDTYSFEFQETVSVPAPVVQDPNTISPMVVNNMNLTVTASESSSGDWVFSPQFSWNPPAGSTDNFSNDTFAFMLPPNDWSINEIGTPTLTVSTETVSGVSNSYTIPSASSAGFDHLEFELSELPSASSASISGFTSVDVRRDPDSSSPQRRVLMGYAHPTGLFPNTSYSLSVSGFGFSWSPLETSEYVNTFVAF